MRAILFSIISIFFMVSPVFAWEMSKDYDIYSKQTKYASYQSIRENDETTVIGFMCETGSTSAFMLALENNAFIPKNSNRDIDIFVVLANNENDTTGMVLNGFITDDFSGVGVTNHEQVDKLLKNMEKYNFMAIGFQSIYGVREHLIRISDVFEGEREEVKEKCFTTY